MEEDTLKGCKEILPRVKALLIETSFVNEFKGVRPSFSHICKKLIEYIFHEGRLFCLRFWQWDEVWAVIGGHPAHPSHSLSP